MRTSKQQRPVPAQQVRDHLRKILASPGFFRAARMQRFLTFVVEGVLDVTSKSSETLKETVIGAAVFDREADYDPKSDPVVRVEARRLRAKLVEYYEGVGKEEAIRIEIPKGAYVPSLRRKDETAVAANRLSVAGIRRWVPLAILASILVVATAVFVSRAGWRPRLFHGNRVAGAGTGIRSLAVLPFRNLSADPAQEYLIDGLTDEITTDLAKIASLTVISRTSADCYRKTSKRLPEIARELKVDALVEGTVLRSGDRVRVTAQLIRSATDSHLWADTYERDTADLFALQTEIAENIARQIGATVRPVLASTVGQAINPEAYDAYLRGRYFWNKRTLDSLEKSIACYRQAIQIDPNYASAYAGLGDSYVLLSSFGGPSPSESFARARESAERALQLDGSLAEAHTVLGAINVSYDWDWQGAASEYRRAVELNPGYPTAHHWYSLMLSRLGRYKNAKAEIQRALELDPLSLIINTDAGEVFYCAREPDQAMLHLRRALELDPNFADTHLVLGKVYEQKRNFAEAAAEFESADKLFGGAPNIWALKGHAFALGHRHDEAMRIARNLEATSAHRYVSGVDIAIVYSGLGDCNSATHWLDSAFQKRDKGLDIIGTDPLFDACRPDPRFQRLLRHLHLIS